MVHGCGPTKVFFPARRFEPVFRLYGPTEPLFGKTWNRLSVAVARDGGSRTVTVARFGGLEVRMTEAPPMESASDMMPFCLEIHSHERRSVLDRFGCFEFGEYEFIAAVAFILAAIDRYGATP